jgi:DNA polymerase-3 subunit delta
VASQSLGDLKPVYLIYGDEQVLLEHAVHRLRARLAEVADLDFNFDSFDGDTADADAVVGAANTMPFMSERRLVIVRNTDKLSTAGLNVLADYAKDPSESACLVLVARKIARNTRLFKAVEALGGVAEYKAPRPSEYPQRVVELFAARGKRVELDAAAAMVQSVGRDLRRLENEVDKVVAFSGDAASLTREDLAAVISAVAPVSIFELNDAIGTRDCAAALRLLADLISQGESVHGALSMSVRQVRTLLSARSLLDRGMKPFEVGREIGLREEWRVRKTLAQARRFEAVELIAALRRAAATELAMKTGGEPRLALERWIVSICTST